MTGKTSDFFCCYYFVDLNVFSFLVKLTSLQSVSDSETENALAHLPRELLTQVIDNLKETENEKKKALETNASKRLSLISDLYRISGGIRTQQNQFRIQLNIIDNQYRTLMGTLKAAERSSKKSESALKAIEETRRGLQAKKSFMQFKTPHHYHLTCVSHHLKKNRPPEELVQPFEVAQLYSGHLRVYCCARRGSRLVHSLRAEVDTQRQAIARVQVQKIKAENLLSEKRKEYEDILKTGDELEKRYGSDIKKYKSSLSQTSRLPSSPSSIAREAASSSRMASGPARTRTINESNSAESDVDYANLQRKKYFQAINVAQPPLDVLPKEEDDEKDSTPSLEATISTDDRARVDRAFRDSTPWVSLKQAQAIRQVRAASSHQRKSQEKKVNKYEQELERVTPELDENKKTKHILWEELELSLDRRERVLDFFSSRSQSDPDDDLALASLGGEAGSQLKSSASGGGGLAPSMGVAASLSKNSNTEVVSVSKFSSRVKRLFGFS